MLEISQLCMIVWKEIITLQLHAKVAELVDALRSGRSILMDV
jgi:hypothetical protein